MNLGGSLTSLMTSLFGQHILNIPRDGPMTERIVKPGLVDRINSGIQSLGDYLGRSSPGPMADYTPTPVPTPAVEQKITPPSPTPQLQFGRVSYYLPTGNQTATGTTPQSGYTAAISRQLLGDIPMGTLIQLPNGQVVRVEDVTAEDILNTLDIYYNSSDEVQYPQGGLMRDVPYETIGRDLTGLLYNRGD